MTLAKSTTSSAWRNPLLAALDHYACPSSSPRSAVHGPCKHAESFPDGQFTPKGFNMSPISPVDLPSKVILDAMFEKVGLPSAIYSARAVHRGCLEITIAFHPIVSELERPVSQTYISTSAFTDLEEAQNHVARKAMEFHGAGTQCGPR